MGSDLLTIFPNKRKKRMNFSYFIIVALFLQAVFLVGQGQSARLLLNNSTDLITDTCKQTQYFDVCVSSLQSRPESRGADLDGLLAVSINASVAHATETVSLMKTLEAEATGNDSRTEEGKILNDCMQMYVEGLDCLGQAIDALGQRAYDTVNFMVSGAMASSDACETGFTESEVEEPEMAERNRHFFKMSSNSLAIAKLLG